MKLTITIEDLPACYALRRDVVFERDYGDDRACYRDAVTLMYAAERLPPAPAEERAAGTDGAAGSVTATT